MQWPKATATAVLTAAHWPTRAHRTTGGLGIQGALAYRDPL